MFRLSPGDQLALYEAIPRIRAIRELDTRRAKGELSSDAFYSLILAATNDQERADSARTEWIAARLRAGIKPE